MTQLWLALALVVALAGGGWYAHHSVWDAGYAAGVAETAAQHAKELAQAQAKARDAEARMAAATTAAAEQYERGKQDAQAAADRVVAELRDGTRKLRQRWDGCEADRVSEAAASASEPDAGADNRNESASRIVRAAAECDAQVTGLQAIIRADRKTMGASQ